jgi:CRISPR-associated protein Csm4
MTTLRYTLRPLGAFGTPLAGDTLFGQLCWTLRHRLGVERLDSLLGGYTTGRPFAVVSDAMPAGHVPLPSLPSTFWAAGDPRDRKALKKLRWLPVEALQQPLPRWQSLARAQAEIAAVTERAQPHNSINRQTGTTGTGAFAPYTMPQRWHADGVRLDLYVWHDASRLSAQELGEALAYIGQAGFGRDASIGLGKFALESEAAPVVWPQPAGANSYLTLGPCAPQGQGFCPVRSHWQVLTRFGRHGDLAVQGGNPFKRPVLLAQAGSVFRPETLDPARSFVGQGLGGVDKPVSTVMPETVHQGYAPVIPILRPEVAPA